MKKKTFKQLMKEDKRMMQHFKKNMFYKKPKSEVDYYGYCSDLSQDLFKKRKLTYRIKASGFKRKDGK